jgi:hypothetical protein
VVSRVDEVNEKIDLFDMHMDAHIDETATRDAAAAKQQSALAERAEQLHTTLEQLRTAVAGIDQRLASHETKTRDSLAALEVCFGDFTLANSRFGFFFFFCV